VIAGFLLNAYVLKFSTAGPTVAIVATVLFAFSLLARK
jgi:hypothetical protein